MRSAINPRVLCVLLTCALIAGCSASVPSGSGQPSFSASEPAGVGPSASAVAPAVIPAAASPGPAPVDPAAFGGPIDNRYLSFIPGTMFVYQGVRDGQKQRDEVTVTPQTKSILGVRCVVVTDTAMRDTLLLEKTQDWYAQDRAGNVWYFGEATATYDASGHVQSTEGSWQGGVAGAMPGIVMPARPQVDDAFRQEFSAGHAEDQFWIVSTSESVKVPFGTFDSAMQTLEWSRLEPDVVDTKLYVAGVGLVSERSLAGAKERAELVTITRPR